MAIRLAKSGYYGGDPDLVMNGRVDIVQAIIDYEGFEAEYEKEYLALNKTKS